MIGSPPNNQLYYIQNGSYLQFQVLATYDQIQEQLGKPNIDDDTSKVRVSWAVRHQDGRELAIWDYNQFKTPLDNIMAWNAWGDITLADDLFIYRNCIIMLPSLIMRNSFPDKYINIIFILPQ